MQVMVKPCFILISGCFTQPWCFSRQQELPSCVSGRVSNRRFAHLLWYLLTLSSLVAAEFCSVCSLVSTVPETVFCFAFIKNVAAVPQTYLINKWAQQHILLCSVQEMKVYTIASKILRKRSVIKFLSSFFFQGVDFKLFP